MRVFHWQGRSASSSSVNANNTPVFLPVDGGTSSAAKSPFQRPKVHSLTAGPQSRPSSATTGGGSLAGSFASTHGGGGGGGGVVRGSAATLSDTATYLHNSGDIRALAFTAAPTAASVTMSAESDDVSGASGSNPNHLGRLQFNLIYNFQAHSFL